MTNSNVSEVFSSIKVLLVEDHALTRLGLRTAFARTQDIVVIGEAKNGEEAVKLAEALKPDVIVMDVGMPILDGIQAAKQIIAAQPEMRIVMLTQHDNDGDIIASLSAGAAGYCLKDVEPERLYTAIRTVQAGDLWLDASIAGRILKLYSAENLEKHQPPNSQLTANESKHDFRSDTQRNFPDIMDRPAPDALSNRELEVLRLIVDGQSNQQIADNLVISLSTAKSHVRNILNKLAVDDRTEAAVHAMRRRLI